MSKYTVEELAKLTPTPQKRLDKIREAGTLRVTRLNAADHYLKREGLITWESEHLPKASSYAYHLRAVEPEVTADPEAWPAGKTFGELTPAQKRAATKRAADQLQAELTTNADAIGRVIDQAATQADSLCNFLARG